jgi:hypothetical protein
MRCFFHGDAEAVAVCKSCGRAICHDCSAEVGTAIGCRNRCESDVEALNAIIERSKTVYRKTSGVYWRTAWMFIGIGVLIGFGGVSLRAEGASIPCFGLCFLFLAFGVLQIVHARRFSGR